jgi:hypothetical protein
LSSDGVVSAGKPWLMKLKKTIASSGAASRRSA